MKIAILVQRNYTHGGSFKILSWLANELAKENDVYYLNLSNDENYFPLSKEIKYIKLNCLKSNSFLERNTIGFIKSIFSLKKIYRENKFDLFINFGDHSIYSLIFLKFILKIKIIVSQRVDPYSCKKLSDKIRFWLYRFCDGLVCQTKETLNSFPNKTKKRTNAIIIPNPVLNVPEEKWSKDNNDNYILSLGRIDFKQKRQDVLLAAMKRILLKHKDEKLLLFGNGDQKNLEKLRKIIRDNRLEENVKYMGITKEPFNVLRKAKMLVLSSDYEGIPNVLIEGMAVGVPIISTNYSPGGVDSLLINNESALIVPCNNPEKLSLAIETYLNDPLFAERMALKATSSLSLYREEKIILLWKNYLCSTIKR